MSDNLATLVVADLEAKLMEVSVECHSVEHMGWAHGYLGSLVCLVCQGSGKRYPMRGKCPRCLGRLDVCYRCKGLGYVFRRPDNGYGEVVRALGWSMSISTHAANGDSIAIVRRPQASVWVDYHEGLTGDRAVIVAILRAVGDQAYLEYQQAKEN